MINSRISDDEAATLYWLGFDVIKERVEKFVPDIVHYTDHLKQNGWERWPRADDCRVKGGNP